MARLLWCLDPLFHHQLKNTLSKLDPPPPPPPDKTFHVLCAKSALLRIGHHMLTTESGGFDLRHHAILETLSAADNIS